VRKPALLLFVVLLCLGPAACGSRRADPPRLSSTPSPPAELETFTSDDGDVSFTHPANWDLQRRDPPGVATISTGGAALTVWAYRTQALVADPGAQQRALARVLASLKKRDPGFRVESATVQQRFGSPGIEVTGTTAIGGRPVKARSFHLYKGLGEYVVDAYADPAQFDRANSQVFEPLLASLRLGGEPKVAG
jgi:hypothetical protein